MIKHQKIALVLSMPMAQKNGSGRNICEANWTSLKNGNETLNVVLRGDIGGPGNQYHNTVRKIGKYRNTVSKIDEIPIGFYDRSLLLSISRVFYLKHTSEINLSLREKTWDPELIGTTVHAAYDDNRTADRQEQHRDADHVSWEIYACEVELFINKLKMTMLTLTL